MVTVSDLGILELVCFAMMVAEVTHINVCGFEISGANCRQTELKPIEPILGRACSVHVSERMMEHRLWRQGSFICLGQQKCSTEHSPQHSPDMLQTIQFVSRSSTLLTRWTSLSSSQLCVCQLGPVWAVRHSAPGLAHQNARPALSLSCQLHSGMCLPYRLMSMLTLCPLSACPCRQAKRSLPLVTLLWLISPSAISLFLSVGSSMLVFPFFTYIKSTGPLGSRLPEVREVQGLESQRVCVMSWFGLAQGVIESGIPGEIAWYFEACW